VASSYTEAGLGELGSEARPGQKLETLSEKYTKAKRAEGVVRLVEALRSNPSTSKKYI
jgi:hypothetical protein